MTKNRSHTFFDRICLRDSEPTELIKERLQYIVSERGSIFDEIWFGTRPNLLTASLKEIESFFFTKLSRYETRIKISKVTGTRITNERISLIVEGEIDGEWTSFHLLMDS